MLDSNLISTLELSLRQTREAQNRLIERLEIVRSENDKSLKEAERIYREIDALDKSAKQTEDAISRLLGKTGKK